MSGKGALAFLLSTGLSVAGCAGVTEIRNSGPPPDSGSPKNSVVTCTTGLSIQEFRKDGTFGVDWSFASGQLAYNKKAADGFENIYVSDTDGRNERPLTLMNPNVPGKHACSPVWHPSGSFLFFSAEKASHPGSSTDAFCGYGAYSDIWVMTPDGQTARALTNVPNDYDHGAMIPRISPDGKHLLWTERTSAPNVLNPAQAFGFWVLKVADFEAGPGGPALANIQTLDLGAPAFNEGGDWSADGTAILFTSGRAMNNAWSSQIFQLDVASGQVTQLTQGDYNEHPRFTPDHSTIIWMSSRDARLKGTDWWLMDASGDHQRRLTFFEDPKNAQSGGGAVYPGSVAWDPAGRWFYGDIQNSLTGQTYEVVKITCP